MKSLLTFTAILEAITGLALLVVPTMVGRLLFGAEFTGAGVVAARMAGLALLGLSVACWPGATALCGMLTYNILATVYLAYLGISGFTGVLLWPAVALHAVLTVLLARAWFSQRKPPVS